MGLFRASLTSEVPLRVAYACNLVTLTSEGAGCSKPISREKLTGENDIL